MLAVTTAVLHQSAQSGDVSQTTVAVTTPTQSKFDIHFVPRGFWHISPDTPSSEKEPRVLRSLVFWRGTGREVCLFSGSSTFNLREAKSWKIDERFN